MNTRILRTAVLVCIFYLLIKQKTDEKIEKNNVLVMLPVVYVKNCGEASVAKFMWAGKTANKIKSQQNMNVMIIEQTTMEDIEAPSLYP